MYWYEIISDFHIFVAIYFRKNLLIYSVSFLTFFLSYKISTLKNLYLSISSFHIKSTLKNSAEALIHIFKKCVHTLKCAHIKQHVWFWRLECNNCYCTKWYDCNENVMLLNLKICLRFQITTAVNFFTSKRGHWPLSDQILILSTKRQKWKFGYRSTL